MRNKQIIKIFELVTIVLKLCACTNNMKLLSFFYLQRKKITEIKIFSVDIELDLTSLIFAQACLKIPAYAYL